MLDGARMSGDAKDDICKGVEAIGFSNSVSSAGIVKISFKARASFKNVETCIALCKASASKHRVRLELSISALRKDVVMSVRIGGKRPLENGSKTSDLFDGKEEFYDRVDTTISAMRVHAGVYLLGPESNVTTFVRNGNVYATVFA